MDEKGKQMVEQTDRSEPIIDLDGDGVADVTADLPPLDEGDEEADDDFDPGPHARRHLGVDRRELIGNGDGSR